MPHALHSRTVSISGTQCAENGNSTRFAGGHRSAHGSISRLVRICVKRPCYLSHHEPGRVGFSDISDPAVPLQTERTKSRGRALPQASASYSVAQRATNGGRMRELNQKRLGYFEAVYEHRSIRRAADALNTAPSVITRQITLLEEELGITLFERRPRGVAPTEVAAHVLEYLRGCHAHRQQLAARLQAVESMEEGSVSIVASEGFMDHLLEKVVGPFCAAHLRLSVELNALSMTNIVRAVAEDEAHIGLAYNPQPDPRIAFVAR